jgi:hypothetical protein
MTMKEQPSQPSITRGVLQQASQPIERPYSRCSIGALVRLLNHTCGASAIHRGIREELCRRWALAAKTKPGEQLLLFTGAEWSRAEPIAVASGEPGRTRTNIQQ